MINSLNLKSSHLKVSRSYFTIPCRHACMSSHHPFGLLDSVFHIILYFTFPLSLLINTPMCNIFVSVRVCLWLNGVSMQHSHFQISFRNKESVDFSFIPDFGFISSKR